MRASELRGQRIAVLGLGLEGRAVLDHLHQALPGQSLVVLTESQPADTGALDPATDQLLVTSLEDAGLDEYDVLVRSPGISPYRAPLQSFMQAGGRITTASNLWFAAHPDAKTVCITGTKGKSTTTALVAHLLQSAGVSVAVGGNYGAPMLAHTGPQPDWWVVELSSYQLADLQAQPTLAGITNLSDEHLDWHGGAARYRADKLRLVELTGGRTLVANHADRGLVDALSGRESVAWFNCPGAWSAQHDGVVHEARGGSPLTLPHLPGRHNLDNLAAAVTLLQQTGLLDRISADRLPEVLADFQGLPHRIHTLGVCNGVRYVDDSLSTTPVATLAALEALAGEGAAGRMVVLVGGADRGLDWSPLAARFGRAAPHAMVAMPDNGPHVMEQLRVGGFAPPGGLHAAADLEAAVQLARGLLPDGGTILLSPGAPSFGRFADYRARGEAFATASGF